MTRGLSGEGAGADAAMRWGLRAAARRGPSSRHCSSHAAMQPCRPCACAMCRAPVVDRCLGCLSSREAVAGPGREPLFHSPG